MAIIFTYPLADDIKGTDWVLGSIIENGVRVVKNFTVDQIATYAGGNQRKYKVYTAVMNSDEDGNPVATVLENTLGGTIVWTREAAGTYLGTLVGAFPSDLTWTAKPNSDYLAEALVEINSTISWDNNDAVVLINLDAEGQLIDKLNRTSIEIRVYNE